jgi:cytochrome P450
MVHSIHLFRRCGHGMHDVTETLSRRLTPLVQSISAIATFFLAMVLNPNVQRQAQTEIDLLTQSERRLPKLSDKERLPYCFAIVLEVLRWGSILPLGAPRRVTEDDVYRGYDIAKDSIIMPNVWCGYRTAF